MLLEECRNAENKLYLAVLLALSTGARQKEIWNLSWKDINLKDEFIIFSKTKTKKTRTVPLKGAVLEMLRNESRRLDTNMLFPSQKNPEKGFDFKRSFKKALANAGIEDFSWHDLRHSCASYLIMSGMDMRKVAEILGHENLSMTKKYTHLKPEHLSDDMERMTRMFLNDA